MTADAAPHGRRDNPSIWTVTSTELTRLRRGFIAWYALLAPVVTTVPLFMGSLFAPNGPGEHTWKIFSTSTLNLWGMLVPMSAGLLAALSIRSDQDSWRLMLSYAVPRRRYFTGKVAALSLLGLVSSTVLFIMLLVAAAINGQLTQAVGLAAGAAFLPWLVGLATTGIAVLVAAAWGLGPSIAVGVVGMFGGLIVADKSYWYAVPFSWPMRALQAVAGVGTNGIPLSAGNSFAGGHTIPMAVALSVVVLALVLLVGGRLMTRKEV
ncbi:ABC transporter permease [Actinoplanes sp. NPDC051859]|uniref:ABC transporter permease n=1 Tax=Actinoplanes sp. NPDC051859 TaxID=3363909 RepID=UPI0037BBF753